LHLKFSVLILLVTNKDIKSKYKNSLNKKQITKKEKEFTMGRPSKKLTPITQAQWDKMESKGLDPKELGFRVKGERGNNNIESASPEIRKPFKELKSKVDSIPEEICKDKNSKNYGHVMKAGMYYHKVSGQTEREVANNIKALEKKK
tara:strand:- start:669 stop:1109 length:441 start_codon:yes stop_codon:yes gene_type:complete